MPTWRPPAECPLFWLPTSGGQVPAVPFPFCCLVVTSGAAAGDFFSFLLAHVIFLLYLCAKFNLFPFCVILPFLSKKGTCRRYNRALYGLRTCRLEPYRSNNVNLELL